MRGRGFYFETKSGSVYYYEDSNCCVSAEEINEEKGKDDREKWFAGPLSASPEVSHGFEVDDKDRNVRRMERYLESDGYKQLILIATEDCNLRCLYCVYSGNYETMRTHQTVYMTWEVARQAIKWYLDTFKHVKERNPRRVPTIGFYGGEPLLCFGLIKQAVIYARELYRGKMLFNVTTNGTLLSGEVANFLAENGFALTITLNGPQTEHDRMRIFCDGSCSFRIIWENLMRLRERYSDYYNEKCSITMDYDAGTDLDLARRFFDENKEILPDSATIARVSLVLPHFTKWHDRYSIQQRRMLAQSLKACEQTYFSELLKGRRSSPFLNALVGQKYSMILTRPQNSSFHHRALAYSTTCIPGDKIAVDPQGNFHCCEKINYHFPIGNIDIGLDMERIVRMLEVYRKQLYPECLDCPITRLCPVCYATVAGVGKFERNPPNLCKVALEGAREAFTELWSWLEAGVKETDITVIRAYLHPDTCER